MAAASLPALAAWNWDRLENLELASSGGPTGLLLPLLAFVLGWAVAVPLLATLSRRPLRDGALAGVLVAAVALLIVLRIVQALGPGNLPLLPIVGLPVGALAAGCGTAAGLVAQRIAQGTSWHASRVAGVACIAAGVVVGVVATAFLFPLSSPLLALPLGFAALLVVAGVWSLRAAGAPSDGATPPARPGP